MWIFDKLNIPVSFFLRFSRAVWVNRFSFSPHTEMINVVTPSQHTMRWNHTSLNKAALSGTETIHSKFHPSTWFIVDTVSDHYTSASCGDGQPLATCISTLHPHPLLSCVSTASYRSPVSQCPVRATQVLCLPHINTKLMHISASTQITAGLSRLCLTKGVCVSVVCVKPAVVSVQPTTCTKHTDTLGHHNHCWTSLCGSPFIRQPASRFAALRSAPPTAKGRCLFN